MFQQCLDSTFLSAFLPLSMTALFAVSNDDFMGKNVGEGA